MLNSGNYDGRLFIVDPTLSYITDSPRYNNPVIYAISGSYTNISYDSSLYVGSALNHYRRNYDHFNKPDRSNIHLQRAISKYGDDKFVIWVLEIVKNTNSIIEREQNWLDYYNSQFEHKVLFNVSKIAGRCEITDELRSKWRESRKGEGNSFWGRCHSEETKQKLREHFLQPNIRKKYQEINSGENSPSFGKKPSKLNIQASIKYHRKHQPNYYSLISPSGELVIIENMSEFCRINNLDPPSVWRLLKGKYKIHRKWTRPC